MRFLGCAARLAVVTRLAGGHNVLPIMAAPAMARQDVVQRQVSRLLSTILAREAVAKENVPASKTAVWTRSSDEVD